MSDCDGYFASTARDIVYLVKLGTAAENGITVSVDAAAGADPKIGVHEDPYCAQPINYCATDAGPGECEVVTADRAGSTYYDDSTIVSVAEDTASGTSYTVRFRID